MKSTLGYQAFTWFLLNRPPTMQEIFLTMITSPEKFEDFPLGVQVFQHFLNNINQALDEEQIGQLHSTQGRFGRWWQ